MHPIRPSAPFYVRDYVSVHSVISVLCDSFVNEFQDTGVQRKSFFFRFLMQHGTKTISKYNSAAAIPKHIFMQKEKSANVTQ